MMKKGTLQLEPVGFVHNQAVPTERPGQIKHRISYIEISEPYAAGLENITEHSVITVVFGLDRVIEVHLSEPRLPEGKWGIFACRSQFRPNHLGVTTCRLLGREGRMLSVLGLDACDGSPVYDLKCPDTSEAEFRTIHEEILLRNPRHDIAYAVRNGMYSWLCRRAALLSGHYSEELGLGVVGGIHLMGQLRMRRQDAGRITLTAPFGTPVTDGFVFVTGISPGSGRLRVGDPGNFMFAGDGWQIVYRLRADRPEIEGESPKDPLCYWEVTHL